MISSSLLDKVAWLGRDEVQGPISGIVFRFSGLGATGLKSGAEPMELEWGAAGALVVSPYHEPWAWMNPRTQRFADELVDAIRAHLAVGPEVPILSTGGSMGGHGALCYALKSRHKIAACLALFPVCDLPYHYGERPDLPRTFHAAFDSYGPIDAVLEEHSPLHQAAKMPDIPYLFIHGAVDQAVNKAAHSDRLVAALRERKLDIEYVECPKMGHGGPMIQYATRRMADFVLGQLLPRK